MSLMSSLGLDAVSADPNDIPDGSYDGEVFKSEYVLVKDKDTISHVVTYRVTDGENKGAQKAQWYTLGTTPRNANGEFPATVTEIATYNPTMSDANKQWYKKLFVDLGIPEAQVSQTGPEALVGKPVTFGIKTKNGWKNINFVQLREGGSAGPVSVDASVVPF